MEEGKLGLVLRGNRAKYLQTPPMLRVLLESAPTVIVEASPYDRIWGIGLAENDPRAEDSRLWRAENRLGDVLTQLRGVLAGAALPKLASGG